MKIGILSDLHMEFDHRGVHFDFDPEPDTFYICAGDISSNWYQYDSFTSSHKDHMFWIDGNHDFYNNDRSFNESKPDLKTWLPNEKCPFKIGGATLWTDLSSPDLWFTYKRHMNDYRLITDLEWDEYQDTHQTHKKFLLSGEFDIIVSHHCPSRQSVHPKYAGDSLNNGFYTELANEIMDMKHTPKLWVHGHTHEEFDYMIGDTRVICHPRGYPREQGWYYEYKPKIVEI